MLETISSYQHLSNIISKGRKIHILGICGIGMSAIAQYLHNSGYDVQGSDMTCEGDTYNRLRMMGIKIFSGEHSSENITTDISIAIHSTAVKNDNIEILTAKELGIPIFNRAAILSYITQQYESVISITGAHGKTTTTTMIGQLMHDMGCDPTIITGGIMGFNKNNFYHGIGKNLMVVEGDESDGTFISLKTDIAVITNIELEHVEYYKNFDHLLKSYLKLITGENVKYIILYGDDHGAKKLLEQSENTTTANIFKYGIAEDNDIYARNIIRNADGMSFDIVVTSPFLVTNIVSDGIRTYREGSNLIIKDFKVQAYGEHNILNTLCSLLTVFVSKSIIAMKENFFESVSQTMSCFQGVARRFNIIHTEKVKIIDDYAHHPSEIIATINAARSISNEKIIAVCQPHRYTRLQQFMKEFATAFDEADIAIVTDVYSAGEKEITGISGQRLSEMVRLRISTETLNLKKCYYSDDESSLLSLLKEVIQEGDIVLFMGAGSITKYAKRFMELL